MDILAMTMTVVGLCLFETVSSIDNAIINADVLSTMGERARRWFLIWGILIAVFLIRGFLPWVIVWLSIPEIGFIDAFFATLSSDPAVIQAVEKAAPALLVGGGVFLLLLFLHWLFLEPKEIGLVIEHFFARQGIWFYAIASLVLTFIVYYSLKIESSMAFASVVGSTAFFITHGFKSNAEEAEARMVSKKGMSDISKILYLEVIDATFSIDGVLGAFAFTLSVPLILLGNGIGAIVVRQLTVGNVERIKKLVFIKNGAMYSILSLGVIMLLEGFGYHIPHYVAPGVTFFVIGFFYLKSVRFNSN